MASRATKKSARKSGARKASKAAARRSSRGYMVFISHSSKENWVAGQIAKEVKRAGASPWVDVVDVRGGAAFQQDIFDAIRECEEAIVLVSALSIDSQWVPFEIGAISVLGKRVTPILNNVPPDSMEPLRGVSAINLNDFDRFLAQLEERVRQHKRGGRR